MIINLDIIKLRKELAVTKRLHELGEKSLTQAEYALHYLQSENEKLKKDMEEYTLKKQKEIFDLRIERGKLRRIIEELKDKATLSKTTVNAIAGGTDNEQLNLLRGVSNNTSLIASFIESYFDYKPANEEE